jgi:uncharacterized protein YjiS (DUF1127 family)
MEMIMSTIFRAPVAAQGTAGHSRAGGLTGALKHWWLTCITWRIEQAAIAELRSMSDLELKDIGLTRCDIAGAVRGKTARHPAFSRYY